MPDSGRRKRIILEGLKYLGCPSHRYSDPHKGKDPRLGFDCSGFIVFLLEKVSIQNPSRHCNELFDHYGVLVHQELRRRGDLVFFSRSGLVPTHVGILMNSSSYIHAPGKHGSVVCISKLEFSHIKEAHAQKLYMTNPIGFKRLAVPNGRYQIVL